MIYHGHVENGKVVFDQELPLPDGTMVRVEAVVRAEAIVEEKPMTLAERFRKSIGSVPDLPEDMAAQHDHYLHGTPKR